MTTGTSKDHRLQRQCALVVPVRPLDDVGHFVLLHNRTLSQLLVASAVGGRSKFFGTSKHCAGTGLFAALRTDSIGGLIMSDTRQKTI